MANSVQRLALYARVSTANGHQDPEMQLRELREYAQRRELTIVGEYIDRMTGSKDSRPSLNRLMADASHRKFDAVLVWKLDRFGRSLRHLVNALAELEALGLTFISLRDNLDLSTPSGRLMFQSRSLVHAENLLLSNAETCFLLRQIVSRADSSELSRLEADLSKLLELNTSQQK
jgi:DNA invertase Pin-like site-specific DNA recombinase